jgi:hypothetical protein
MIPILWQAELHTRWWPLNKATKGLRLLHSNLASTRHEDCTFQPSWEPESPQEAHGYLLEWNLVLSAAFLLGLQPRSYSSLVFPH